MILGKITLTALMKLYKTRFLSTNRPNFKTLPSPPDQGVSSGASTNLNSKKLIAALKRRYAFYGTEFGGEDS